MILRACPPRMPILRRSCSDKVEITCTMCCRQHNEHMTRIMSLNASKRDRSAAADAAHKVKFTSK
jgi:hypothetical protein